MPWVPAAGVPSSVPPSAGSITAVAPVPPGLESPQLSHNEVPAGGGGAELAQWLCPSELSPAQTRGTQHLH